MARLPHDRALLVLARVVVVLLPLIGLPREDDRADLPVELNYLYAADVAFIALGLLALPRLLAAVRGVRRGEGVLWLALFGLMVLAFAVHPSQRGLDALLRIVGAAGLFVVVRDLAPRERAIMVGTLGLTAILQSAVAVLQVASGAPLGLEPFGELEKPLQRYEVGPPLARGAMGHEYILASLALVSATALVAEGLRASRPAGWLASAALAIVSAGLVYGRTVAVCVALVCASLVPALRRSSRHRWALAALVLGVGIPALIASQGWAASFSRGLNTDRGSLFLQALVIVAEEPLFGVGPGNYVDTLIARPELHITRLPQHVHNVPMSIATEAGIPAGVLAAVLLVAVGWRSWRAGVPALTIYLAFAPWLVFDVLSWVTPQGMVITALWLAFLHHAVSSPEPPVYGIGSGSPSAP